MRSGIFFRACIYLLLARYPIPDTLYPQKKKPPSLYSRRAFQLNAAYPVTVRLGLCPIKP